MKEENEFFRKLKNAFLPPLFFLSSVGLFPPFPREFSYFRLAFSIAGAVLCAVFFLFLFLSFGNGGEKREKTRFFLSLFSGIFFLVLPLVLPLVPFAQGVLLPLSCGLLFLLPVCLPGDEDEPEEKGEERKPSAFFRLRFFALCAGFCLGGVLCVFPTRTVPELFLRMSAPFVPLLILLLCLFASRREENRSQKAWKCVLVFLLLAGGAAGVFFLPANARTLPEKLSRIHEEKAKADPASTVLAGIVAAGQFSRGVVIHVLGDRTAGKFLRNGPFPARIAVLDTKNPFSEGELPMRVLDRNAFQPGKAGGTHVSPPENPDILFASPGELKFPFDVFLSLRLLRALDGQFAHGRGVFVLLLSCLEGEKAKAAEEEACRRLSRIYANVYAVSTPRMVLASDAALNLDPETLGIRGGEEFFPKGILKIFLPDLKKSPLYRKKGDAEKETFPMMPFSFLLHGEARQGLSGMILKAFLFWAELLHESYWLFWALFLPGYFVFRYFRSPGEKPKKFFRLFEHAFFLAGFPCGVICLLPEKWLAKELFLSFLLLPALAAFLAAGAGGIAAGRKKASSGSTPSVSRRILSLLPSLLSSLLPWLGLCLCLAEEEHCTPGPAFFPFALSFFRFSLALLFLLAGAFCGSSLEETMEGLEKEELPRILLIALAGSFLAFSLILPVAFGGWTVMVPLFVFLSLLRICVLRKN